MVVENGWAASFQGIVPMALFAPNTKINGLPLPLRELAVRRGMREGSSIKEEDSKPERK
jgi:hypothetical protein